MQRRHRKTHAYMWKVLAIFLPAMLIAALAIRQHGRRRRLPSSSKSRGRKPKRPPPRRTSKGAAER